MSGQWEIIRYGDGDSLVIHVRGEDERVCFMATPGSAPGSMERIEKRAHLIVTAPELLIELKYAVKLLEALPGFRGTAQVGRMVAAIARATQPGDPS